jgi:hypothetical protein
VPKNGVACCEICVCVSCECMRDFEFGDFIGTKVECCIQVFCYVPECERKINFMPRVCTLLFCCDFMFFPCSQQDYLTTPRKLNVTCSRACGNLCPCLVSDNCFSWTSRHTEAKPTHTFTLLFPISFPLWKLRSHKMKTHSHFPLDSSDVEASRKVLVISILRPVCHVRSYGNQRKRENLMEMEPVSAMTLADAGMQSCGVTMGLTPAIY